MKIFTPIKFRNVELRNRVVMSPMCMFSCENGVATDFHLVHYGSRALGGVGLILVEATAVSPDGRISPEDLGIWNSQQGLALKRIVDFVHSNSDSKIGIQLAHAGRKASTRGRNLVPADQGGWETVAPSAIPYSTNYSIPHELTQSEIKDIKNDFIEAAKRAILAGFDVIEIHAAHGYLLHQFLSPLSNQREDEYGGSFENRARLLIEIVESVNALLTQKLALFVRISGDEYAEDGWNIENSVALAKILKKNNVDVVDVSSGGNIAGAKITLFDGYQVPFSARIRNETGIATGAVGLISSIAEGEVILKEEKADLILYGRELLRNPFLVTQAAIEDNVDYFLPKQYEKARK